MKSTVKAIIILIAVAMSSFFIGIVIYSVCDLGSVLPNSGILSSLVGKTMSGFGMKIALVATLGTLFLVPPVRHEFMDAFTVGSDFKRSKGSKGGRF